MNFQNDSTGTIEYTVQEKDLASNWKNSVDVLSTPILLWLAELACMEAVKGQLEEGYMSLGAGHFEMKHLAPSLNKEKITVTAKLITVTKNKLLFKVEAHDQTSRILTGLHERAVVKTEKFEGVLEQKREALLNYGKGSYSTPH